VIPRLRLDGLASRNRLSRTTCIASGTLATRKIKASFGDNTMKSKHTREWILIIVTLALAGFTAWMAFETHRLAIATRDSLEKTDTTITLTKESLEISKKEMALLKDSKAFNEQITQMDIQPYIAIDSINTINVLVGQMPIVYYSIVNTGKTPAYNVHILTHFQLDTGFTKNQIDSIRILKMSDGFYMPPGIRKNMRHFFPRKWEPNDSIVISNNSASINFLCGIKYEDGFHNIHFSQEGFLYDPKRFSMLCLRRYTITGRYLNIKK
jgi:hypothetical protein